MTLGWHDTHDNDPKSWTCGYCGKDVGGNVGYTRESYYENGDRIYICPRCNRPTVFISGSYGKFAQVPKAVYGNGVDGLPNDVATLYDEARRCIQHAAYTAATLALRKLLMHVAVDCGANENLQFVKYVDYLDSAHYIPPNARDWVDTLRKYGNDATHQIMLMNEREAKLLLDFAEMLLKIVYEFPAKNADS